MARKRKKTRFFVFGLALVGLVLVMLGFLIFGPSKPIVVSNETTRLTEPLDESGNVDYFDAIRRQQKQGVTPENNAAVLIWQALGRMDLDDDQVAPLCRELGIVSLPAEGDYLVNVEDNTVIAKGAAWLKSRAEKGRDGLPPEPTDSDDVLDTEKPFLYERRGEGYLLYSVGRNQQDDGGTSYHSTTRDGEWITDGAEDDLNENNDDLVIRLPLPPFQWPRLDVIEE